MGSAFRAELISDLKIELWRHTDRVAAL